MAQVPIALHFLKDEAFGLWMAMTGAVQLMSFADLGIGLGLQNKISEAFGKDDFQQIRNLHHAGVRLLGAIGLVLAMCTVPLLWFIPWGSLFKVADASLLRQMPASFALLVLGLTLGLPLNAGVKLAAGVQQGWLLGVWTAVGSIIALLLVAVAAAAELSFVSFIAVTVLAPLITNWGTGYSIIKQLGARFHQLPIQRIPGIFGNLLRQGLLFLLPQASSTIITAAPSIFIASIVGTAAVTPFSLCQRMSSILLQFQGMPLFALWPAYAEAKSRGDKAWITSAFRKSLRYGLITGLAVGGGISLLGGWFILLWTRKPEVVPSPGLLGGFAIWTAFGCFATPLSVLLNGTNRLRGQAIGGAGAAIAMLLLIPTAVAWFGTTGAVGAMLVSWIVVSCPFVFWDLWKCRIK